MSQRIPENVAEKLREIVSQHDVLAAQLLDPEILTNHRKVTALSIKKAAIAPLVEQFESYEQTLAQRSECEELLAGNDAEIAYIAKDELPELDARLKTLTEDIQKQLVTADEQSVGSVIVEIRPGVGGDEATLWAQDIEEMYRRFAQIRGWKVVELDTSKTCILSIAGEGVWTNLGFESGTHQVKRVPSTETQGRIHTSTATVAVLPEPEEVEVELDPNDVKESITNVAGTRWTECKQGRNCSASDSRTNWY